MRLWGGQGEVAIAPRALQVLEQLVTRPGRLVTRESLEQTVWADVRVAQGALRYCIREIRKALDDRPESPEFVETVGRRGWRFVGAVASVPAGWLELRPRGAVRGVPGTAHADTGCFVDRQEEIGWLIELLGRARAGTRQVVFVSGEVGIGKTALVERWLEVASSAGDLLVARGHCLEHGGPGEAYLPVLDAIQRVCAAGSDRAPLIALRRYAPMWLAQMPSLTTARERSRLGRQLAGATQERMLRELAHALEVIAAGRTLVLWLEDLHWSDHSTLELLSLVARRREPARLFVVATCRDGTAAGTDRLAALRRELELHGWCRTLALGFLPEEAVREYLTQRFAPDAPPDLARRIGRFVHERTEGNPLFMVSVVDSLVERGVLTPEDGGGWSLAQSIEGLEAPYTIEQLLEQELGAVDDDERPLLEVASLAGMEFAAAAVAAGAGVPVEVAEARCEGLARRGRFLRAAGREDWPDGTISSRYAFVHALHRDVLSARVPAARRAAVLARIGLAKERAFAGRTDEIASELARCFEAGGDACRAAQYFAQAGERAARRHANQDAADHLRRALALSGGIPSTDERREHEVRVRLALSVPLAATQGYASAELEGNLHRIQELIDSAAESDELFAVLLGLWSLHVVRAHLPEASRLASRLLRIAERTGAPLARLQAERAMGHTCFYAGDLARAREHLERGIASYDTRAHRGLDYSHGDDPLVLCRCYRAWVLWFQGSAGRAAAEAERAVDLARRLSHPPSLAFALAYDGVLHELRREPDEALARAEALLELADQEGFSLWHALGSIVRGWAIAAQGGAKDGIERMREGLAAWERTGADLGRPHFLGLVAEACGRAGRMGEALELLAAAKSLVQATGQHVFAAELLIIEAELALLRAGSDVRRGAATACEAERHLRDALATSRRQGATALERRSALALSRLLQEGG